MDQNQDIIKAYFQNRVHMIWDEVIKPIFGGKHDRVGNKFLNPFSMASLAS